MAGEKANNTEKSSEQLQAPGKRRTGGQPEEPNISKWGCTKMAIAIAVSLIVAGLSLLNWVLNVMLNANVLNAILNTENAKNAKSVNVNALGAIVQVISLEISVFAIVFYLLFLYGTAKVRSSGAEKGTSKEKKNNKLTGLPFTDGFIIFLLLVGIIYYALTPPPTKDKDLLSFAIIQAFMLVFSAHLILKSMR